MTPAELIALAIKANIVLIVFALALTATFEDALYLFRRPGLLARSIISMNVIMPVFAAVAAVFLALPRAVELTLVALALSPVPPILPNKQAKAGGTASYAIGLLFAAGLFAILLVPLGVELVGIAFGKPAHMPPVRVASVLLVSIIAPLVAGLVVRHLAPAVATRVAKPLAKFATLLLIVALVPILFAAWPEMVALVGNGTLLALVVFTIVGLIVGHLLGGPEPGDRTNLALATAARHPGVALAIAAINFPEEKTALAVVLWQMIAGAIVAIPYMAWRRHRQPATTSGG